MVVKPSIAGVDPILLLAVAGKGDKDGAPQSLVLAKRLRDLITVHAGKSDVQKDQIRPKRGGEIQTLCAVVDDAQLVAGRLEQPRHAARHVHVVVDDEDAAWAGLVVQVNPSGVAPAGFGGQVLGRGVDGEPDREVAPRARTLAPRRRRCPRASSTSVFRPGGEYPIPRPPCERSSEASTWAKGSKMCASASAAMPIPVSCTRTTISSPSRAASNVMRPPSLVYFTAFVSRLPRICSSRAGSASTGSGASGRDTTRSCFLESKNPVEVLDRPANDVADVERAEVSAASCRA